MIPGSGRFPGEGNGIPLQYPCLENPMDRGAWWATVHRVANGQTLMKRLSTQEHTNPRHTYKWKRCGKVKASANFQAGQTNRTSRPSCAHLTSLQLAWHCCPWLSNRNIILTKTTWQPGVLGWSISFLRRGTMLLTSLSPQNLQQTSWLAKNYS